MLVTRPYSNGELRRLLEDLAARHFAPGDLSFDRGLITEAARRLPASEEAENLLQGALHALRSYQHGNASVDLAKTIADKIETELPRLSGRKSGE